jgi:hypothetical protein
MTDDTSTTGTEREDVSLEQLHEVPYSEIEGAYAKVKITDEPRPMEPERIVEIREGKIIGRGNGWGTTYDTGEKEVMEVVIGPSIYLDTPEETTLEVRTDKRGNELLEFNPEVSE